MSDTSFEEILDILHASNPGLGGGGKFLYREYPFPSPLFDDTLYLCDLLPCVAILQIHNNNVSKVPDTFYSV